ncbi:MAG: MYG1 family protein [Verrucomicrobiota bacterium]
MLTQILTHPGGSHKDEFLACCVLIAKHPVAIVRREPTPEDLENPQVAVIDVGHDHNPAKNNFDHHQFDRDATPTCSLSLVLQHLKLYDEARLFCDWLETAEWLDCRGPNNTAKELGVDRDIFSKLVSPIDVTLLRRFAQASEVKPGELLYEIMQIVGQDLLEYVEQMKARLVFIEKHAQIWEVENRKFIFLPRTDPLPAEPSAGLGRYVFTKGLESEVIGMIYPDRRSEGYGLSRYDDSKALDFTQIDSETDVHFAHRAGFVAKTTATDKTRLKQLLAKALVTS